MSVLDATYLGSVFSGRDDGEAIEIGMQFPRLRARLEGGVEVGYATAHEHSFEFGLKVILDGLENELAARR